MYSEFLSFFGNKRDGRYFFHPAIDRVWVEQ